MKNTTGKLIAGPRTEGQSEVRGTHDYEDWDRDYFQVSGYFGSYGPHLIAAAPDLYEALEDVVTFGVDYTSLDTALAALAKARGETK